jgi:thiamine kinase-like enzyme
MQFMNRQSSFQAKLKNLTQKIELWKKDFFSVHAKTEDKNLIITKLDIYKAAVRIPYGCYASYAGCCSVET